MLSRKRRQLDKIIYILLMLCEVCACACVCSVNARLLLLIFLQEAIIIVIAQLRWNVSLSRQSHNLNEMFSCILVLMTVKRKDLIKWQLAIVYNFQIKVHLDLLNAYNTRFKSNKIWVPDIRLYITVLKSFYFMYTFQKWKHAKRNHVEIDSTVESIN